MHVSVVVPTYRRPKLLERCLTALAWQDQPTRPLASVAVSTAAEPGSAMDGTPYIDAGAQSGDSEAAISFEVIVADDADGDAATQQVVERAAAGGLVVRYLPVTGRHGPAAARNAGWRAARGEIVAFTDDDCLPQRGWLAAGSAPFADEQVVAATGHTIVPLPPAPTDYERDAAGLERSEFITANCFVRRSALEALGGFDESFTAAWREDSDLQFRLLDTGGVIAKAVDAVVVHPVRPAPWGISLKQQKKICFDALLFRKHPRRFRERIGARWPWHYYTIVVAAAVTCAAALTGWWTVAGLAACVWGFFTLRFFCRRLRGTARTPAHIGEMLVTSLAIPFIAVFWRLYGAIRFRVAFW